MNLEILKAALEDELEKISEVSLMSLEPQTVLNASLQQPLETTGVKKAKEALLRSSNMMPPKMAAVSDANKVNKKYISPALAGAATGIMLTSLIPFKGTAQSMMRKSQRAKMLGAALGAALNIMSKQGAASPAIALSASQKVGKFSGKIKKVPKVSSQIRGTLVGRKGTLPGV